MLPRAIVAKAWCNFATHLLLEMSPFSYLFNTPTVFVFINSKSWSGNSSERVNFEVLETLQVKVIIIVTSDNQICKIKCLSCLCWVCLVMVDLISHTLMPSTVTSGEVALSCSAFFIFIGLNAGQKWNRQILSIKDSVVLFFFIHCHRTQLSPKNY